MTASGCWEGVVASSRVLVSFLLGTGCGTQAGAAEASGSPGEVLGPQGAPGLGWGLRPSPGPLDWESDSFSCRALQPVT